MKNNTRNGIIETFQTRTRASQRSAGTLFEQQSNENAATGEGGPQVTVTRNSERVSACAETGQVSNRSERASYDG